METNALKLFTHLLAPALALGGFHAAIAQEPATPEKPNIILLFADDLGYGDLGIYGNPVIQTPNLDALARGGARFTSFYAQPACSQSRSALLTGRYPIRPGSVPQVLGPESETGLAASEITIASGLKTAGYRTKIIGKWHLGHAKPEFLPTSHGFDEYLGLLYSNDMIPPWVKTERPLQLFRDTEPLPEPVDQHNLTRRYTDEAVEFIRRPSDAPYFLYLPYAMTHLPLGVSQDFRDRSRGGLYGDAVEELDWSAGEILKAVRESGKEQNTLIIWTSDNGPWQNLPDRMLQSGPDGLDNLAWHVGTPGPFRGSKGSTYEGGVRVPAIFYWPGTIPGDRRIDGLARTLDVLPTVLNAVGLPVPSDRPIDGNNLLPVLKGESEETPNDIHFYFAGRRLDAVRKGPWKLQRSSGAVELFHLDRDFSERINVAAEHPDRVAELNSLLEAFAIYTGTTPSAIATPTSNPTTP